ncbi:MAG: hypothetical protein M0P22_12000 [Methanoculleus sp.]|nr:hypothetical protein [Methanoculleus sp.]
MALRGSHTKILLVAGLIGVILSAVLLFPGACATVIPSPPAEEVDLPGNASSPGAGPENGTVLLLEPVSDDERLESLIAGAGIPLLEASVEQICSVHTRDDAALMSRAADMSSLVDGYRAEAAALEVSPDMAPAYTHFIAALDEFAAAGTLIGGNTPLNRSVTEDALGHLALGTGRLSDALQDCNRPPAASPNAVPVLMSLDEEPAPGFPDALQSGERFCYDDARKENSASLVAGPVTWSHAFHTSGTKPVQHEAASGKFFLLVTVKATHLGHKGDGVNTRIQMPAESAFVLHYGAEAYRPLPSPGPTNQGGSYSRVALGRGESLVGYLFFEVPEDLDLSRAYLQVSVGKDSPVWLLG